MTNTYEGSGSQFFKITPEIQSGPDTFDESRLVMTLLTNLGVTWVSCSSKLALEVKADKEMFELSRSEFFAKFSGNNFA